MEHKSGMLFLPVDTVRTFFAGRYKSMHKPAARTAPSYGSSGRQMAVVSWVVRYVIRIPASCGCSANRCLCSKFLRINS